MSSEDPKTTRNVQITAAFIGAGAVIIAAIIGLAASKGGSSGSSGGGPPSASTTVAGSDTGSPSPTASAPSSSVTLVWQHSVRFPYETGLDLNDNQPTVVSVGSNPNFNTGTGTGDLPGFQLWQGKAGTVSNSDPTFSDCMNSFVSQAQEDVFPVRVGQSACFESQDGTRVAAVTVLSWDKSTWAMYADVKVWQTTGS
jgi:hypothetical protein